MMSCDRFIYLLKKYHSYTVRRTVKLLIVVSLNLYDFLYKQKHNFTPK